MKLLIQKKIYEAAHRIGLELKQQDIQINETKSLDHGHFSCNLAMILAKKMATNPRELALKIVEHIEKDKLIQSMEVAGPGFMNFVLTPVAFHKVLTEILSKKASYGQHQFGQGIKVLVEYVSANPTGPLHVGHGRNAMYGSVLVKLLAFCGYDVLGEYYVNDAGRQMDILAASVWMRYCQLHRPDLPFPEIGYQGDYVYEIAKSLNSQHGDQLLIKNALFNQLPPDASQGGDKEMYMDALITLMKAELGQKVFGEIHQAALDTVVTDIREDLEAFGVEQSWFSEQSLVREQQVENSLEALQQKGVVYQKDGALWFKATDFGDEKDRVLVRSNGQFTYFAVDIAYHHHKYERGFEQVIDVFGSDHHGYVPRMKAALQALGHGDKDYQAIIVQFAVLFRGKTKLQMSTRKGSYITLRQLREEIGKDAGRFFYVMRKNDQHMDFDLELAKERSSNNPAYYIQYAHARIMSVFSQLKTKKLSYSYKEVQAIDLLNSEHEQALQFALLKFPDVVESAAKLREPHLLTNYLQQLAHHFHALYNASQFLVEDEKLRQARLMLVEATGQVIRNGLKLIGITAPEKM